MLVTKELLVAIDLHSMDGNILLCIIYFILNIFYTQL